MKSLLIALAVGGTAAAAPSPDFLDHQAPAPAHPDLAAGAGAATRQDPSDSVVFAHDSATLMPAAVEQVDQAAQWLRSHPDYIIVLEGYTDDTGDPDHNANLAFSRASTVKAQLGADGIDPARVVVVAYSETRVLDRRVHMYASRLKGDAIAGDALHRGAARATWVHDGAPFDMGRAP